MKHHNHQVCLGDTQISNPTSKILSVSRVACCGATLHRPQSGDVDIVTFVVVCALRRHLETPPVAMARAVMRSCHLHTTPSRISIRPSLLYVCRSAPLIPTLPFSSSHPFSSCRQFRYPLPVSQCRAHLDRRKSLRCRSRYQLHHFQVLTRHALQKMIGNTIRGEVGRRRLTVCQT
jgi:hypothetical protein